MVLWITGNSGAGKTPLAEQLMLISPFLVWLDGDVMRTVWELGFSREDRWEQNIRVAKLAKIISNQGHHVLVSTICPYKKLRQEVFEICDCDFIFKSGGRPSSEEYPYEEGYY